MAKGDIFVKQAPYASPPVKTFLTEAGATDINPGEPVKRGGTGNNYAVPLASGDPEVSADLVLGIAQSASSHDSSNDGTIEVYLALPGIIYECAANDSSNINTQSKLDGVKGDRVAFDLSSSIYTVDENEGDNSDHGLVIMDGDINQGTLEFMISDACTLWGNNDV